MNTVESDKVRELFDRAVELPVAQRAAFLDQQCRDHELRAQVERLLAADAAVALRAFLPEQSPPADRTVGAMLAEAAATLKRDPLLGQRIGRYHIKSLAGVGGMARVYEAVQDQPHRVVALKVMNHNATARSALRRFQYESQVLGRLRHPNIAQIFEAGVATAGFENAGVEIPYFAMEYLPGARPITRYVVEKALDVRRRVELFIKICDGVHHGHQRGVIHRDLKPANLLVEASGEPKVIDFGVARGTDSDIALTTQQTHLGELVGTMQYMSPEQCDGDPHEIDTRSDVYSLGVVLYELLTGSPPYSVAGSTIYQASRIVQEHFPARPSTVTGLHLRVARRLRADVDTIVLKAIEKDRDRRYDSAAALSDDLRRCLAGDPIQARRPTIWSRVTRWMYRRPAATLLFASAVASMSLVAGGAFMGKFLGWYWSHQPARVQIVDDGMELRICARDGTPVFQSDRAETGMFMFATILELGPPVVPHRPLVVGVAVDEQRPGGFERGLYVFDADAELDPSKPARLLRVEPDRIPARLKERTDALFDSASFGVKAGVVADMFAEVPGNEIAVAFQHSSSAQTAIVVFDLNWQARYWAWVDGQVHQLYWISGAAQLVLVGCNGRYLLHERDLEYHPTPQYPGTNHPLVVFAIKPVLDFRTDGYVAQEPDERDLANESLIPAWYWMLPNTPLPDRTTLRPAAGRGSDRHVVIAFESRGSTPNALIGVDWTLDEDGKGYDRPHFGDTYELYRSGARPGFEGLKNLPKDHWHLKPLPPIRPECRRPDGSPSPKP